jgi:molybdopterin synthase sulfur carrier subunit
VTDVDVVTVRLPQALAEHAGGRRVLTIAVPEAATLRQILEGVAVDAPAVGRRVVDETGALRRYVNVYVDEDECRTLGGLDTPVPRGTTVHILPSVAGG